VEYIARGCIGTALIIACPGEGILQEIYENKLRGLGEKYFFYEIRRMVQNKFMFG
jgi:hypothetical protein